MARCAHEGQYRRNGEPVFLHCVETAKTVAALGLDQDSVSAALLHDVLDDSMMTETHLRKVISADVVNMVKKVSLPGHAATSYVACLDCCFKTLYRT